jgi:uncharacterized membrane protein
MRVRNLDLTLACLWAAFAVSAVLLTEQAGLRALAGAPMVLLVPGHVLLRALAVRTESVPEHLIYAIGASIALCIAGGFSLHGLHALTPLGWALWLWGATIVAALVAAFRDLPRLPVGPELLGVRFWHIATLGLALLVAAGAYGIAIRDELEYRPFRFTEFWLLPGTSGDPARLVVGIRSAEAKPMRFSMEVFLEGRNMATVRGIEIAPGATWTREVPVTLAPVRQKAEARLIISDEDRIYRRVSTWVPGT